MSKNGKSFIRYLIWFVGSLLVLYVLKDLSPLLIYYFGVILGGVSYILTELS